ncbi:F-box-like/WD repeat-containing EBI like protein [Babesia gibsoni]|uniref:F-box-like/WD repeat-containing EBI like protein n=1 Tax=Babesia gibsoni TaxID=33632 RepID=A0AAD8UTI9_BABGI|nr:F-box-like/WD repeat-containing EBI like protein [Babesia gibsoni]KAK1444720.1 F-box-like/WD repeat-containing EBI like protein [Babesia gibsoni]
MKVNLTSDDINLLVYRYLIENGYTHTAFCFNKEAEIQKNPYYNNHADKLPPNALVSFMQKAMIYIYIEYHTDELTGDQIVCEEPFSFFKKHTCFRKLGQQRGVPIKESMFLAAEREASSSVVGQGQQRMDVDNAKKTGVFAVKGDEVSETGGNALTQMHPIYVGPPQRRLADKWQLMRYTKLLDYSSINAPAEAFFNPVIPQCIVKRVENAPPAMYTVGSSKKAKACDIVPPDVTLIESEDSPTTQGTAIKWRLDGQLLCVGYASGTIVLWDSRGKRLLNRVISRSTITAVAFSGDRRFWNDPGSMDVECKVAVGDAEGNIAIFKIEEELTHVATYNQRSVVSEISWRDHTFLAVATADTSILLYDTDANEIGAIKAVAQSNPQFMEWGPSGKCLAIVDNTNVLKLYKPSNHPMQGNAVTLKAHTKPIVSACWQYGHTVKATNKLCTIGMDKQLFVWDVVTETVVASTILDQIPTTISVNSTDTALAIGTYGNRIKIYNLPSLTLSCSLCDQELPTSITWAANDKHIAYNVYGRQRTLVFPIGTSSAFVPD